MPFVGRDQEVEELAALLADQSPRVLVLHGLAGVGKSALAAALVERLRFGRRPVHWLSLDGNATEETVLLRLLAEHGAPRRPILTAAVRAENAGEDLLFARLLSEQVQKYVRDSVLVLDGAHAALLRRLLRGLLPGQSGPRLVIATSRVAISRAPRMHVHEVRPLDTPDAVRLIEGVARPGEPAQAVDPSRHARAAQGLPVWLRVAGALPPGPHDTPPDHVTTPDALLALATRRLDPAARGVLQRLALRVSNTAPFSVRTVEALLPDFGGPYDAPDILSSLRAYELVGTVREGLWALPSCVADAVQRDIRPGDRYSLRELVVEQQRNAALNSAWHAVHPLDGRPKWFRSDLAPMDVPTHIDEFMALLDPHRSPETLPETLAAFLAVRGDAHRLIAVHRQSGGRARRLTDQTPIDAQTVRDRRRRFGDGSPFQPFVVLNACHAGVPAGGGDLAFLGRELIHAGARGVLGPQIEMPQVFAAEYALEFVTRYLHGAETAGAIAHAVARRFADELCNPLGLAYALHHGMETRLERAAGDPADGTGSGQAVTV